MKAKGKRHNDTGLIIGIPKNGKIQQGHCTLQEVYLESLRNNLDEFREAQRRIDRMRKSR